MQAPPAAETAPLSVVERYVAAINANDDAAIADSFAEDASWRLDGELPISGVWSGREQILGGFFAAARSLLEPGSTRIEITSTTVEGERAVVEWTSRARTTSGEDYENRCIGVFVVREGRIQAVREYMDTQRAHGYSARASR